MGRYGVRVWKLKLSSALHSFLMAALTLICTDSKELGRGDDNLSFSEEDQYWYPSSLFRNLSSKFLQGRRVGLKISQKLFENDLCYL
jgi:hypothetical protein